MCDNVLFLTIYKGLPSYAEARRQKVEAENVAVKVRECVECAIECAEELLTQFNRRYPVDTRHANTVQAARAWLENSTPDNHQQLKQLLDEGCEWANEYAAPARRYVQAAWQAANAASWAAQVEVEENAIALAQNEANRLNEIARHAGTPEGTVRQAQEVENALARARKRFEQAEKEQMYRRKSLQRVRRLEQQVIGAQIAIGRAEEAAENYQNAQRKVTNGETRKNEAAQKVRNAAREVVRLTRQN